MYDEAKLKETRFKRIRRIKWLLKYTPRRAFLHKYPFIKFFAGTARKRSYLWSFKVKEVIPALYIGSIISFMPLYGVQIPVAFALSILFRSNLMIMVALQFITNPFTIAPIYALGYKIGDIMLYGIHMNVEWIPFFSNQFGQEAVDTLGQKAQSGIQKTLTVYWKTVVGGIFMGYVFAFISSIIYRQGAKRAKITLDHMNAIRQAKDGKKPPPPGSEETARDEEAFL